MLIWKCANLLAFDANLWDFGANFDGFGANSTDFVEFGWVLSEPGRGAAPRGGEVLKVPKFR